MSGRWPAQQYYYNTHRILLDVERDPGENMAKAERKVTLSEKVDDIKILSHPWWTTPGQVLQPHSSTEFRVRYWQKGLENYRFVFVLFCFFNWQILHT